MRRVLTMKAFAEKLGYPNTRSATFHKRLDFLKKSGVVKVQQSGFAADSQHHHKIVIVKNDLMSLERFAYVNQMPSTYQTIYSCPYCGRILDLYEYQKTWRLGSILEVLLECFCLQRFVIIIKDKSLIKKIERINNLRHRGN